MTSKSANNPQVRAAETKEQLTRLIAQLRNDIPMLSDNRAKALFEVSAEVLIGLQKAFSDYEEKRESAWQ